MKVALVLLLAAPFARAGTWTYWIQPCPPRIAGESKCEAADPELAEWALRAWEKTSQGALQFTRGDEARARIRLYWATGALRLYGEARPIVVNGQIGAEVYVLPDVAALGPEMAEAGRKDTLYRHTVVYLTCLHETGHALGLPHTRNFVDIMYSFRYGGDIVEYFARYRRKLTTRADIEQHSGISPADGQTLRGLSWKP